MKKITLLVAGLLFAASLAHASEINVFSGKPTPTPVDYREAEPVIFTERGIEFMVFPNGEMDFNTEPVTTGSRNNDSYYRRGQNQTNGTYGAPGTNTTRGTRVEHDSQGRVRRVGNVYINYDAYGRVKRIGTVYMTYNRYALTQIGNLRIQYDGSGRITGTQGYINGANRGYTYEPYSGYDGGYGNSGGYDNGGSDDDHYYYRKSAPKQ